MKRILLAIGVAAIGATLAIPASAYTPNPDDNGPYPCFRCGKFAKPGSLVINPAIRFGQYRLNKVALNPQPLPPKALRR